jgi:glycosyltransferase involved in cell wall biosynthesis
MPHSRYCCNARNQRSEFWRYFRHLHQGSRFRLTSGFAFVEAFNLVSTPQEGSFTGMKRLWRNVFDAAAIQTGNELMPKLAVIVAAYNAERTIVAAVESVLSSPTDCRVYVVDDGSKKPVEECLRQFMDRIVVIRLNENVGPARARNAALKKILEAGFEYVAIMDADDISTPTRLEKQLAFLETHPTVGVVGSWLREFHHSTRATIRILPRPSEPEAVHNLMFFNNALPHASAMIRADAFKRVGLYSINYPAAEDYELLRRIGLQYELANLPEYLVHYRISPTGVSQARRDQQLRDRFRIQLIYFDAFKWQSWAGVGQTMLTMLIPRELFQYVKSRISSFRFCASITKLHGL